VWVSSATCLVGGAAGCYLCHVSCVSHAYECVMSAYVCVLSVGVMCVYTAVLATT
jgi:hypothetical protein